VRFRERHDHFTRPYLDNLVDDQRCPSLGKFAAEHASDVEQRVAAANQADVMWAIADGFAFGTQDRVL
jgi:hypothetical protein